MTAKWLPRLSRVVLIRCWLIGSGRLVSGDRRSGEAAPLRTPDSVDGTGELPSGSQGVARSKIKQERTNLELNLKVFCTFLIRVQGVVLEDL
jgi:hypothetical protein